MGGGARRIEVNDADVVGVVYQPEDGPGPPVVVLSGSGGGIPEEYARKLAEYGLTAFGLGYFGAPGLPPALVEIPVEMLGRGIDRFGAEFGDGRPVGVMGSSKGAELALVLASHRGDTVGPVVAVAPSCVVWYGLDRSDVTSMSRSSWTWRGSPLPFLAYREDQLPLTGPDGVRIDVCYDLSQYDPDAIELASIPIERAQGPILLLSGDDDHMWDSAGMAARLVRRAAERETSTVVESVVYAGAGHAFLHREFFPNVDARGRPVWDFGGTSASDGTAAGDAWPRISAFFGGAAP